MSLWLGRVICHWASRASATYLPSAIDMTTPLGLLPVIKRDRKSTRLNSSHSQISYDVFCLKKKKILAERVPYKAIVGEDAAQVRVPLEHDAEEVESLSLEPVGRRPHVDERAQHRKVIFGSQ